MTTLLFPSGRNSSLRALHTRVFALCALTVLSVLNGFAQQAVGTIEGRVQNATNGQYIKNAVIVVNGTNLIAITGEYGDYRLSDVPAGEATLTVTYGGLATQTATLSLVAGQTVQKDFNLTRDTTATSGDDGVLVLDAFTVKTQRDTNAGAIAANEQRHAPNIKNVVSVDAFGDVNEGNAAEMLKYLPGVSVNYIASNANTVSVRGFDPAFTTVNVDGGRVATASLSNASRAVDFFTVNTNSVARVEVVKAPTPDKPADSLGGSINLVSRSAFEYSHPQVNYQLNVNMNSQYRDPFKKTAGPYNGSSYKTLPGGSFNYVLPVNKNFGVTLNGLTSNQFNVQRRAIPGWAFSGSGASQTNPAYRSFQVQDSPSNVYRATLSTKLDWRFAPRQTLSLTLAYNWYKLEFSARLLAFQTGNATAFDPSFTQGTLGTGTVNANGQVSSSAGTVSAQANSTRQFYQDSTQAVLNYRFDGRVWKIEAGLSPSNATAYFRDRSKGHLQSVTTTLVPNGTGAGMAPLAVRLQGITYPRPGIIQVTDGAGNLVDYSDQRNYRALTVNTNPTNGSAHVRDGHIDASRDGTLFSIPFNVKFGGAIRSDTRDNRRTNDIYTVVGPDGLPNTADDNVVSLGLLDTVYINQDNYYGFSNLQFPSTYRAWDLWKAHPEYFRKQDVNSETNRINGSERLIETVTAGYVQTEMRFFGNKLRVLTGVRFEETRDEGFGPKTDTSILYQRDANGNFIDSDPVAPGIQRIRKVDAPAAGSLAELYATRTERGMHNDRKYHGYYPSVHVNYEFIPNTVARVSVSKSIGRPDLSNVIPTVTITENTTTYNPADPNSFPGLVSITNTSLKPWTSKNTDISLEHYFKNGGLVSAGVFRKDISDFWGNLPAQTRVNESNAQQYAVPPGFEGYELRSKINVGAARVSGVELNFQQPLNFSFLPHWVSAFTINANATRLHLEGANNADFGNFTPVTRNAGITYNAHGLRAQLNFNFRGRQRLRQQTSVASDAYLYYTPRSYIDVNLEYQITKHLSVFGVGRNITNVPQDQEAYGPNTPAYARSAWSEEFGVQMNFGIKGSF